MAPSATLTMIGHSGFSNPADKAERKRRRELRKAERAARAVRRAERELVKAKIASFKARLATQEPVHIDRPSPILIALIFGKGGER